MKSTESFKPKYTEHQRYKAIHKSKVGKRRKSKIPNKGITIPKIQQLKLSKTSNSLRNRIASLKSTTIQISNSQISAPGASKPMKICALRVSESEMNWEILIT